MSNGTGFTHRGEGESGAREHGESRLQGEQRLDRRGRGADAGDLEWVRPGRAPAGLPKPECAAIGGGGCGGGTVGGGTGGTGVAGFGRDSSRAEFVASELWF